MKKPHLQHRKKRKTVEFAQTSCDFCNNILLDPIRLACGEIRHVLCACCYELSVRYHRQCPVCARSHIAKANEHSAASKYYNGGDAGRPKCFEGFVIEDVGEKEEIKRLSFMKAVSLPINTR